MRIGLDAHTLGSRVGGNETFIRNLVSSLSSVDVKNEYFVYAYSNEFVDGLINGVQNFQFKNLKPKNPFIRIPFSLPQKMIEDRLDLFLLQYAAPPICPAPYVLVVHDISYERYPEFFNKAELTRLRLLTPLSLRNASHVVTCSEFTKEDMIRHYRLSPKKISVIYYGKNEKYKLIKDTAALQATREKYDLLKPYILYVGNIQPRKNLNRLLLAFKDLKDRERIPHNLVIVGNKAWLYSDVFKLIKDSNLTNEIIVTGYVPEEELPLLYNAAELFVYPSIFEGFGFPVLEAMACGVPVVTSNSSSLPEVAGDGALLINPLSVSDMAQAMHKILTDTNLREELKEKGLRQAERFTWNKTANDFLKIFERVAK